MIRNIGIHVAVSRVGNRHAFKYFIKGNRAFISWEFIAEVFKATWDTVDTRAFIGDTRSDWIWGDIGGFADITNGHLTHK